MSRGNIRLDRQDGDVASPLRAPGLAALYALYNSSAISTMTEKKLPNLPSASDGSKLLPSFQKNVDGSARFVMVLPRAYHEDPGLSIMARCEALHSGYEFPYRKFLDSHLEAGDVFIDIGAHFGIYSLSAVTAPCGDVRSLAVEPDSHNVRALKLWTAVNKKTNEIEIIEAACSDRPGMTKLWFYSTMGHQVGDKRPEDAVENVDPAEVPVVTIDQILADRPTLMGRRTFIKIDVEGIEPEVIAGAMETLATGTVMAIIFEKAEAYTEPDRKMALELACQSLTAKGFTLKWFPHLHLPSVCMPWVGGDEMGNIVAVSPELETLDAYDGPACPYPALPPSLSDISEYPYDEKVRADFTERLIAAKASDGWRWSHPSNLEEGASDRVDAVANLLPRTGSVIDIGAGTMALFGKMPIAVTYTPVDLVRYSSATVLADLNQGQFPHGHWDCAVLLETLEFIHDVAWLLKTIKASAGHLIMTYRALARQEITFRRSAGYFNDFTVEQLCRLLEAAGWVDIELKAADPYTIVSAR